MCILITCSGTSLCFFHVVHASSRQQTSADDRQIASIKSCTSYNPSSSWQVKICWEFEMNLSKIIKFVSHFNRAQTHNLVSAASFCMISMMVVQALEQPSGVEWIVMGFSAAPAFSFLWMSILEEKMRTGQLFVKHLVQKWGRSKCSTLDKKASVRDVDDRTNQ